MATSATVPGSGASVCVTPSIPKKRLAVGNINRAALAALLRIVIVVSEKGYRAAQGRPTTRYTHASRSTLPAAIRKTAGLSILLPGHLV